MTVGVDPEIELAVAVSHLRCGRLADAEAAVQAALAASAGCARLPALRLLAAVLGRGGRDAEAAEVLAEAASFDAEGGGRDPACWNDLGVALERAGEPAAAEAAYRRALALRPDFPEVHNHLGNCLRKLGRLAEAAAEHREAIRLRPGYAQAYNNLRAALFELGEVEEGLECDRRAAELEPGNAALGSALLYNLHNSERVTPEALFQAHREWARRHTSKIKPNIEHPTSNIQRRSETPLCHPVLAAFFVPSVPPPEPRTLNPEPLRIGYVSQDFREHPVGRFLEPVLANHDRSRFAVYCYSDVPPGAEDAVTRRLRGCGPDVWRQTAGMPDEEVARLVRADGIDILVDLTGHMAGFRPGLFARKPAAVQVAHIGYPDTTGMGQMDYKITDSLHDPPGETEHLYTEKLVRLDPCCWCYWPGEDAPEVGPLPALAWHGLPARGAGEETWAGSPCHVTFGVMNRLVKASPTVMRLWAKVLEAVPRFAADGSRGGRGGG